MKKFFMCFAMMAAVSGGAMAQYQVQNSDFEAWIESGEPLHWHGFKSAKGGLAGSAKGTLESSETVRDGVSGKCAVITSGNVFGIVNNGTFTTGQLQASSMFATNTANHAEMDKSSKETDKNGDKFYMPLTGHPDAMKVWIKFSQKTPNTNHPYASASAIIFDGSYYQDPEDKTYTNVVAKAANRTIATCDWTEFTIPFVYEDNNVEPEAILVTFGTNATPGQGSSGDQVFVDDMVLVYNSELSSVKYDGNDVSVARIMNLPSESYDESKLTLTHNAKGNATIEKSYDETSAVLTITVKGEDCISDDIYGANADNFHTYTIHFAKKGDVNGDGNVTIADVTALVNIILGKNDKKAIADVNGDGPVTIADVTALVNIILGK